MRMLEWEWGNAANTKFGPQVFTNKVSCLSPLLPSSVYHCLSHQALPLLPRLVVIICELVACLPGVHWCIEPQGKQVNG